MALSKLAGELPFDEFISAVPERYRTYEENIFGAVLEKDFSMAHIDEDPLIANFAIANHFLDYDYSLRRTRALLRLKFLFSRLFGRR